LNRMLTPQGQEFRKWFAPASKAAAKAAAN
jgi:hypothetical protein